MQQMQLDEFKRCSVPVFNFGILRIYGNPQDNVERMKRHDEIMYEGDIVYPDPHQKGKWVKPP